MLDRIVPLAPILAAAATKDDPPFSRGLRIAIACGAVLVSVGLLAAVLFSH